MKAYRLELSITIREGDGFGGGLTIRQEMTLPNVADFMHAAKIIGQFHDLAMEIEAKQSKTKP